MLLAQLDLVGIILATPQTGITSQRCSDINDEAETGSTRQHRLLASCKYHV